jgi:hypothetical protein
VSSWQFVVIVGQAIASGVAAICAWGLKDRLVLGGQPLAYVCLALTIILVPIGVVSGRWEPGQNHGPPSCAL